MAAYLLGCTWFLTFGERFQSFPLDDAWIHQVYARAFAAGHGFEYNDGIQEAGATSPLWVIVTSPVHWFAAGEPTRVVAGVIFVGMFLGIVSILLFWLIARHATTSLIAASVAASLFAIEPRLLFSTLSGMETALLVALWLGSLLAMLHRRWLIAAALIGLMGVTRPESLVILPVFAIVRIAQNDGQPWHRRLTTALVPSVPFIVWALFCHSTSGHWLPNTYYIKAHALRPTPASLVGAWRIVGADGFGTSFLFPVGIATSTVLMIRQRRWLELIFIIAAPVLYLAGVAGTRMLVANGYYWTRWVDPASLMFTAAFALGLVSVLASLLRTSSLGRTSLRWLRLTAVAVVAAGLVFSFPRFARSFADRRTHLRADSHVITAMNIRAGLWIANNAPADAVVGVNDAGAIRYFGGRPTVDLLGINNQALAFLRTSLTAELHRCDWLAIFPTAFRSQVEMITQDFSVATVIRIPQEEYTICDCPGQNTLAVFTRKSNSQ
jgi:hypothetical protein